jgi:uncharacterized protein (TIGR01777 family)
VSTFSSEVGYLVCKDHSKKIVLATSVLITGASGLIGAHLTKALLQKGFKVSHLGRTKRTGVVPSYVWNVDRQEMDTQALKGIDTIVHLAGAGIADHRWTSKRKKEILESRTKSTALLYESLKNIPHLVKTFVSASAIGYYGFHEDDTLLTEESKPGGDYLSGVVAAWENEADRIASLGIRVAKIRIGIVLSDKGGALKEMANPIRWGVGAPLGTGKQMVSWIHLDDLCSIFMKAVEDESAAGAFNATAPHPVTNRELTRAIAKVLKRPLLLPPVPGFVLHAILGEMADIVVNGSNVSSEKIQKTGFAFKFELLEPALKDLLVRRA